MKIRIFTSLKNGVYFARVQTEDWSENDRDLMKKYGEPAINLGGTISLNFEEGSKLSEEFNKWAGKSGTDQTSLNLTKGDQTGSTVSSKSGTTYIIDDQGDLNIVLGDNYARIMTESPFTRKFDTRDVLDFFREYLGDETFDQLTEDDRSDMCKLPVFAWTREIRDRIFKALYDLREKSGIFSKKEEIFDFSDYTPPESDEVIGDIPEQFN